MNPGGIKWSRIFGARVIMPVLLFTCVLSHAQPNIVITPSTQCPGNGTVIAMTTATAACATSYSWNVYSPSCAVNVTTLSNSASGSTISITNLTCCGVYTVYCAGLTGSVACSGVTHTVTITL